MPRLAGWLVVVPLLVVACGGGHDGPAVAPTVSFATPAITDGSPPENAALPLTSLQRPTLTNRDLLERAAYTVTAECMAEQGFDYPAYEPQVPSFTDIDHPFGPWTQDEVRFMYVQEPPEPRYSLWEQFTSTLPANEAQAWGAAYGDPRGEPGPSVTLPDGTEVRSTFAATYLNGCGGRGLNAVFGDYAARDALRDEIEELVNQAFVEAEGDDAVEQALDFWHDCMEAQGFDVEGGGDGPQQLAIDFSNEPGVSDEERRAAAADIDCKEQSNLHDAYFAARAVAEQELIDDNQLFVEAWREMVDGSLARARAILADAEAGG